MPTANKMLDHFGRYNLDFGNLFLASDVDAISDILLAFVLHLAANEHYDEVNGVPRSGVAMERANGSDLQVIAGPGDLDLVVLGGLGFFFNPAQVGADPFLSLAYLPICLEAPEAATLTAHDPTNPRIDLVVIRPLLVNDQATPRQSKDPVTQVVTNPTTPLRRRFSAQIEIVTGTPAANPGPPTQPTDAMLLARIRVPAGAGAAEILDGRPVLERASGKSTPHRWFQGDFVPRDLTNDLLVEVAPFGLAVLGVTTRHGKACIDGQTRGYSPNALQLDPADPTNPRIDVIVATEAGVTDKITGTPAANPSPPAAGGSLPLALVSVAAGASAITAGDIVDIRQREPYPGTLLQRYTTPWDRMTPAPLRMVFGVPVPDFLTFTIPVTLTSPDGVTPIDPSEPLGDGLLEFYLRFVLVDVPAATPPTNLYTLTDYENAGLEIELQGDLAYGFGELPQRMFSQGFVRFTTTTPDSSTALVITKPAGVVLRLIAEPVGSPGVKTYLDF